MLVTSRYQASVRALVCLMLCLVTDTRADAAAEVLARADAFLNNNTISQGFKVTPARRRLSPHGRNRYKNSVFAWTQSLTVDLIS